MSNSAWSFSDKDLGRKVSSFPVRIRKSLPAEALSVRGTPGGGLPACRLKRVLTFIDAHLDEKITLAQLARNVNLSVFYFATLFKKSTGFSPRQYMLHRRVHRARELLRDTRWSVLDVSLDLGFQHQNNFARAFRRITGMSPTRFRCSGAPEQFASEVKSEL
jgi:AraC-like DNA-binding protein